MKGGSDFHPFLIMSFHLRSEKLNAEAPNSVQKSVHLTHSSEQFELLAF